MFMRKTIICVFFTVLLILPFPVFAQLDLQMDNYWENPYYITPASMNVQYQAVFSMAARKQWFNVPGSPTTYYGSATMYSQKYKTQEGIRIIRDEVGFTQATTLSLSYSYHLRMNDTWFLNMGIAGSYQHLGYDLSKINLEETDDPSLYESLVSRENLNADLGFEFYNADFKMGFAGRNLLSLFLTSGYKPINANYLYAIYRFRSASQIDLGTGACLTNYDKRFQGEANVTAYFKNAKDQDLFSLGAFYRSQKDVGLIFGLNLGRNLYVSYSYDYIFGKVLNNMTSSHELMLIWKLKEKDCKCNDY